MSLFQTDIEQFNAMYKLPVAEKPTLTAVGDAAERLRAFKNILLEEVEEVEDIIPKVQAAVTDEEVLDVLTDLADWLGDIQVYSASEMAKFGLSLDDILSIIMESNLSKLGEDGKPIYDERGKVMKGPNYFKPEPAIKMFLSNKLAERE